MTPTTLDRLVRSIDPHLPDVHAPDALLRQLEQLADRQPASHALREALLQAHGLLTAFDGLPGTIAGVRRETVVRWDTWTVTFDGPDIATGRSTRVRTLRDRAARDPVLRRALAREGRALARVLGGGILLEDGAWPALRADLGGAPLGRSADHHDLTRPELLVRMLVTGLVQLSQWEEQNLGLPELSPREWIDTGTGVRVLCLSPTQATDPGPQVAALAAALRVWWGDEIETAVDGLLAGLETFPPHSAAEAVEQLRHALSEELAGVWYRLRTTHARIREADRTNRLLTLIERLAAAMPAPPGRGAVGVDMEGETLVVESRGGVVTFGEQVQVVDEHGELDVREGRRLLRVRASAPANPRLQAEVGGSIEAVDHLCQWVAAALQLRTVRLLLTR